MNVYQLSLHEWETALKHHTICGGITFSKNVRYWFQRSPEQRDVLPFSCLLRYSDGRPGWWVRHRLWHISFDSSECLLWIPRSWVVSRSVPRGKGLTPDREYMLGASEYHFAASGPGVCSSFGWKEFRLAGTTSIRVRTSNFWQVQSPELRHRMRMRRRISLETNLVLWPISLRKSAGVVVDAPGKGCFRLNPRWFQEHTTRWLRQESWILYFFSQLTAEESECEPEAWEPWSQGFR